MFVQGSKTLVAYDSLDCMKNDIIAIFGENALKKASSSKKRGSRGNKKNKKIFYFICNTMGIFQGLQSIGKQLRHFTQGKYW